MDNNTDFLKFVESIQNDVKAGALESENERFSEQQFTDIFMDYLVDSGEIDERNLCFHQSRGSKVNAYAIDTENANLDLIVTLYCGDEYPGKIQTTEIQTHFNRLKKFFQSAIKRDYVKMEESDPAYDLADNIYKIRENLTNVRFFFLTDGITIKNKFDDEISGKYRISYHVWDINRLYRLSSSGRNPDPIIIDFFDQFKTLLPCIPMPVENPVYTSYLLIIPGNILSDLYDKYGPRLLERNVRAYLQLRGTINQGIRDTIINEPHMFMAYNNGVSATAESIKLEPALNGNFQIREIKDFQIVNGGQTTATIHQTHKKLKTVVSDVFVQVKLTVIKNPEDAGEIVPNISKYANSQNKTNSADFTSNYPFHVRIQGLSRSIWAPARHGFIMETHWYYERVRGQYQDEKGRKKPGKEQKVFAEQNPTSQRFTKTDLAKYENSWLQIPHIVSLGAEKNYREFMIRLEDIDKKDDSKELFCNPDEEYFKSLIGKAILFKKADKLVLEKRLGGYKANIVTYSIAMLSVIVEGKLNFGLIWKEQDVSEQLQNYLDKIIPVVHNHIINSSAGKNITEWCKKEECWNDLKRLIPGFQNKHEKLSPPEFN